MVLAIGTVIYVEQGVRLWYSGERAVVFTDTATSPDGTLPKSENVEIHVRWPTNPPANAKPNEVAYALRPVGITTWSYGWVRGDKLYHAPSLTELNAVRVSDISANVTAKGKFLEGSTSSITYTLRHKKRSASSWTTKTGTLTLSGDNWTLPSTAIAITASDSYDIQLTISDGVGDSQTWFQIIGTAGVPLSLGYTGIGVNALFQAGGADLQIGPGGLSIDGVTLTKAQLLSLKDLL